MAYASIRSNASGPDQELIFARLEETSNLLYCKKTFKTTYFNINMFIQHAPPKMAGREPSLRVQSPTPSKWPLGRLQILLRGLQLLPSKRLHKVGNSEAQLLRSQAREGTARASVSSLLLARPLSGIKPQAFGRAQLYPFQQANKRLSSVQCNSCSQWGRRGGLNNNTHKVPEVSRNTCT